MDCSIIMEVFRENVYVYDRGACHKQSYVKCIEIVSIIIVGGIYEFLQLVDDAFAPDSLQDRREGTKANIDTPRWQCLYDCYCACRGTRHEHTAGVNAVGKIYCRQIE